LAKIKNSQQFLLLFSNLSSNILPSFRLQVNKHPVMRYGGVPVYLRPLFLGFIVREFSMALLWLAIGWAAEVRSPLFLW